MLPRDIPTNDDQQGLSSVSGSILPVKGPLLAVDETSQDVERQSETFGNNQHQSVLESPRLSSQYVTVDADCPAPLSPFLARPAQVGGPIY
jgi:hypothetical protein